MSQKQESVVLWFRRDLRLADNPSLIAAVNSGKEIYPIFIYSPEEEAFANLGGACKWWLHQSLISLDNSLKQLGSRLFIFKGNSLKTLQTIVAQTQATAIYWNRRYEPNIIERDKNIKKVFQENGLEVKTFNSHLLFEPWEVQNSSSKPFQVFTAFWKAVLTKPSPSYPLAAPALIKNPSKIIHSLEISHLELEPKIDWAKGLRETWNPGEKEAQARLAKLLAHNIANYKEARDFPSQEATSRLSPFLNFGEISPRQIWHNIKSILAIKEEQQLKIGADFFLRELIWREFAYHLLYYYPETIDQPLRKNFSSFPWNSNEQDLTAWQKGQTGFPIVDAGMRELWHIGWMHNRVRMIVASFLTKDLLIAWQEGASWFWDTLVDADLANNTFGWQWTAGCGADAAPFFRVFNPVLQGEKFDPEGNYIRRWIPELSKLPNQWIHKPWQAPLEVLKAAKVSLGTTYPKPIIDHSFARERALEAFAIIKGQ